MPEVGVEALAAALGPRARRNEPLAPYTAMRVGGPAELLVTCSSIEEVSGAIQLAQQHGVEWRVLGGGCNVLVADRGVAGLIIINKSTAIGFTPVGVRAEAGAALATVARLTVERGLAGLEWAAGLPGSVGGAIVGNAGAFEGDIAGTLGSALVLTAAQHPASAGGADVLHHVVERPSAWFEFGYRTSRIKQQARRDVILEAVFPLQPGDPLRLAARMEEILTWRRTRHPSGATMGSTFKNPPGSHAGYLIEQAGLRGHRIGGAQISELHGNFFMNTGGASAADVWALIEYARDTVFRQFGVELELEIELVGWTECTKLA